MGLDPRLRGDDVQKPAIGGRRGSLGFAHAVQIEIAALTLAMTTWAVREPPLRSVGTHRAVPKVLDASALALAMLSARTAQRRVRSPWKGAVGENLSPTKVSPTEPGRKVSNLGFIRYNDDFVDVFSWDRE